MTRDPADIEALFADLKLEYLAELPARLRELSATLAEARAQGGHGPPAARARGCAHRLHGTAGTYGFASVGALAGRIQDALVRAAEAGEPVAAEVYAAFERDLDAVRLQAEAGTLAS